MAELILVTGGSGVLGRALVPRLLQAGYRVRTLSRHAPTYQEPGVEWLRADMATGEGLPQALQGVHTVVHTASNPARSYAVDVEGTRRTLLEAKAAGVSHFVYISIAGCDRIPMKYYQHKAAAERLVETGSVPWSILRIAQFHTLLDSLLRSAARLPVLLLPTDFLFQPIAPAEAADGVVSLVHQGPAGRLPALVGPRASALKDLAREWLEVQGMRRLVLPLPLPGRVSAAFRAGYNTAPGSPGGHTTWAQWLKHQSRA